jgi:hypothetical protein
MNYPKTDGVYGPNYRIAEGLMWVQRGSWEFVYKIGGDRRKIIRQR